MSKLRTYERKRGDPEILNNVRNLCRLCLQKAEKPVPIFEDENQVCQTLPMRIMICLGLDVANEEYLPNMICSNCLKDLNSYYSFKKTCLAAYQKLKAHFSALKAKHTINHTKNENESNIELTKLELKDVSSENAMDLLVINESVPKIDLTNESPDANEDIIQDKQDQESNPSVDDSLFFISSMLSSIPPLPEDLTNFLTLILVQLGVLTKDNDQIAVVNQTFKNVQLETVDGSVSLELVEVDEDSEEKTLNGKVDYVYDASKGISASIMSCATCNKKFTTRAALLRHEKAHLGLRPYICNICNRGFTQNSVLQRHMHIHTDDRPFNCRYCVRGFTQRNALRAHELTHAACRQLSIHRCPDCPKIFLHASGLSRHQLTHTGLVYVCSFCSRPFKDQSSCARHYKKCRHKRAS